MWVRVGTRTFCSLLCYCQINMCVYKCTEYMLLHRTRHHAVPHAASITAHLDPFIICIRP